MVPLWLACCLCRLRPQGSLLGFGTEIIIGCQIFLYSNMTLFSLPLFHVPSLALRTAISGKTLADFHHSPISRHLSLYSSFFLLSTYPVLSHISISCNCSPHAFPSVSLPRLIMLGQEVNINNSTMLSDSNILHKHAVLNMFIILVSAAVRY